MIKEFNFKQVRSFSEVFQGSADFLRQEGRFFLKMLTIYAGPLILISAGMNVYFQESLQDIFFSQDFLTSPFSAISGTLMLTILFGLLSSAMLYTVVYAYINLYTQKGSGNFTQDELWEEIKTHFLMVFITLIAGGLVIGLGFILFIIPGIYVAVPLSLIFMARMNENLSLAEGFNRVFRLIRSNWWQTLGILIVAGIIVFFLQLVVSLPQTIYNGIKGFQSMSGDVAPSRDLLHTILGVVTIFLNSIVGAYTLVVTAIQFFNLKEYHDQPDLNQRVQELYGDQQNPDNV